MKEKKKKKKRNKEGHCIMIKVLSQHEGITFVNIHMLR